MSSSTILIAGAGPTGLALAVALRRAGVAARVIDAGSGPAAESRALAIHARTLEVLGDTLARTIVDRGQPIERLEMFDGARQIVSLSLAGTPTLYPFVVGLSQSRLEEILIERLRELGGAVEWNTRLAELHPGDGAVAAVIDGPGGRQQATFDWVIGCDGVHSTVRDQAQIAVDPSGDSTWWILADAELGGEVPDHDAGRVFIGSAGVLALLPIERPGWWRLVAVGERGAEPEVDANRIDALLAARCPLAIERRELGWCSAFQIREHLASSYRAGRVLIAGDAAHAHSPLGGQGMNTGIQDACNLAWKLAIVAGGGSPALLDSYEAERRPVGKRLVRATGRGTRAIYISNSWLVWLRNRALEQLARLDAITDRLRENLEMLTIAYPDSPIVGDHRGAGAAPGERAPVEHAAIRERLDRPEHTVLLFDGAEPSEAGYQRIRQTAARIASCEHMASIAVVPSGAAREALGDVAAEIAVDGSRTWHRAFGAESEALIAVRPDGYIGWRSQPIDVDGLAGWWSQITGLPL